MSPSRTLEMVWLAICELLRRKGESKMLNVGDAAPDFTVQTHQGETVKLSDQRGKTIVLWFYPKADTPG
jgi:peroxiredoxin Q/BCP